MRSVLLTVIFCACGVILRAQSVDYSTAKVERIQGLYVFTDCQPVAAYEFLGTVSGANVGMKSPQYQIVRDGLIKKLREDFPNADGVILQLNAGAKDKADAIKFK